jgi:hypothetical protein
MLAALFASFLKKNGPVGKDGKPRPLTADEMKTVLESLKPVLESLAEFAERHALVVSPAFEVTLKGYRVRLGVEKA